MITKRIYYKQAVLLPFVTAIIILAACSDDATVSTQSVALDFAARVNDQDFVCGNTFTGVGSGNHNYKVTDFRMYIHGAHIHDELTDEVYDIELDQDGVWQLDNVAMLDFENSADSPDCNGTPETNTQVLGAVTIPNNVDLTNTEVCFEVGLPFDKNHIDEATAASPLNASGMLWAWLIGRKYIRIDGVGDPVGTANNFNLHLGAQGCSGAGGTTAPPDNACSVANTLEVCLADFNTENDLIVVDPAAVFENNDISMNLSASGMGPATPKPGCQSFIGDDDCEEIMPRLGLNYSYGSNGNFTSAYAGEQRMFSKQ